MIFQAKTQAEIFLLSRPPGSRESQERRGSNLDVDDSEVVVLDAHDYVVEPELSDVEICSSSGTQFN